MLGVSFTAASRSSAETVRRQARVSLVLEHPTRSTMKSYMFCVSMISPTGVEVPELIMPARKRPSVSPPFAYRWRKTDIDPALSPQLWTLSVPV